VTASGRRKPSSADLPTKYRWTSTGAPKRPIGAALIRLPLRKVPTGGAIDLYPVGAN